MELIQKSNFRIHGMFFSTIVLRKIKTRHTLKKACISCYLAIITPRIYATKSVIKKIVSKFSKNEGEGRGQRPYEIFPKIHSIW